MDSSLSLYIRSLWDLSPQASPVPLRKNRSPSSEGIRFQFVHPPLSRCRYHRVPGMLWAWCEAGKRGVAAHTADLKSPYSGVRFRISLFLSLSNQSVLRLNAN
ncbi:hypothetical protein TNIN_475301 [Trichonephila inaurata madagascariensis]|uniref:Uncharacterized protein n=1 Tax=Trichonephila inaurata madagascariensis TaxID=2747483 RepID=A0A8X6YUM3_9ARAC|nr:hypothetical protein TNIN_475301 [Trichonephila inaurata madagascariensis]